MSSIVRYIARGRKKLLPGLEKHPETGEYVIVPEAGTVVKTRAVIKAGTIVKAGTVIHGPSGKMYVVRVDPNPEFGHPEIVVTEKMGSAPRMGRKVRIRTAGKTISSREDPNAAERARLVSRIEPYAGGHKQASAWFDERVLPGFGMTAKQLVDKGLSRAVDEYIEDLKNGVFS